MKFTQVNIFEMLQKNVDRYLLKYNYGLRTAECRFHFIIDKN